MVDTWLQELLTGYCDQALSLLRLRYEVFFDTGYEIWLFRKEKKKGISKNSFMGKTPKPFVSVQLCSPVFIQTKKLPCYLEFLWPCNCGQYFTVMMNRHWV